MADVVCLNGTLRKGKPCWTLDTDDGSVFLVGELTKVHDGDVVYVCGHKAQAAFCGPGRALAVTWISTEMGGGAALQATVARDVEVVVTQSSRDTEPTFRLEGNDGLALTAQGGQWRGRFEGVSVEGTLDVFFLSKGWVNQKFTMSVAVTDPADASKSWKKEFSVVTKKGQALINESIDVGAAPPTGGTPTAIATAAP